MDGVRNNVPTDTVMQKMDLNPRKEIIWNGEKNTVDNSLKTEWILYATIDSIKWHVTGCRPQKHEEYTTESDGNKILLEFLRLLSEKNEKVLKPKN